VRATGLRACEQRGPCSGQRWGGAWVCVYMQAEGTRSGNERRVVLACGAVAWGRMGQSCIPALGSIRLRVVWHVGHGHDGGASAWQALSLQSEGGGGAWRRSPCGIEFAT
jgi:hypothetical protein